MTVDHGEGVLDRIGVVTRVQQTEDAIFADMDFANTQAAQEVRELIRMGAVTDVSAGVLIDDEKVGDDGVTRLSGSLDHVAVVVTGAFGNEGTKVLAVHSAEGDTVEETEVDTPEAGEQSKEIERLTVDAENLRKMVVELSAPGSISEPKPAFDNLQDFVLTFAHASNGDSAAGQKMAEFALLDDTTTTATGLVPDFFSRDIIGRIFTDRPYVSAIPSDPIGDHGMTIQYPKRTAQPLVDVQATEKSEVASQVTSFVFVTVDLLTYAGASDVALQLIERSAPSFVDRLFMEYADVYAAKTDTDAVADAVAGAGDTAILADLGADAAATWAAVALAATVIFTATRRSPDILVLAPDRWGQLISLVDTDGRPLVVLTPQGPTNAQGTGGGFHNTEANYNGLRVIVDPNAAVGTCIVMDSQSAVSIEQTPQQLRALQVSLLGMDMGIWALFAHYVKYADGIYTLTLA